jgi:hypothetical protein
MSCDPSLSPLPSLGEGLGVRAAIQVFKNRIWYHFHLIASGRSDRISRVRSIEGITVQYAGKINYTLDISVVFLSPQLNLFFIRVLIAVIHLVKLPLIQPELRLNIALG